MIPYFNPVTGVSIVHIDPVRLNNIYPKDKIWDKLSTDSDLISVPYLNDTTHLFVDYHFNQPVKDLNLRGVTHLICGLDFNQAINLSTSPNLLMTDTTMFKNPNIFYQNNISIYLLKEV